MSAPRWLKGFWAKTGARVFRGRKPRTEEPRELCPALLDERWLAAAGLVDHPGAPYNAKGLHAVMVAVDAQPYALWKMFVARLIATARRFSKDLHEQSIYVERLHSEMEAQKKADEATIEALQRARAGDALAKKGDEKDLREKIERLTAEVDALRTRAEKAEKAEQTMVDQVRAANEFREGMKAFVETTTKQG